MNLKQYILCGLAALAVASSQMLHAQTDTTLTIHGKKFAPGVKVYYDSLGVSKQFAPSALDSISARRIKVKIPQWLLNQNADYPITVENPAPSRGRSNVDTLRVRVPAQPRTDTAIAFRYAYTDQYWHERVDTTLAMVKVDSIVALTALRSIKQSCTVSGSIFRDGKYRVKVEKRDDPMMADYVRAPRIDNPANHEIIDVDATATPARITVFSDNDGISNFTTQLAPMKDLIDTLGADPRQRFPGFVTGQLPQTRMTLAIARAKGYTITPLPGAGRVKLTINNPPSTLFGTDIPAGTKFIMRLDTLENYVESTELWRGSELITASYYKLKDGTAGANPQYEVAITHHFYTMPRSGLRMKAIHTREYNAVYVKSYLTPIPNPTR
jgi:hypothetical protein